MDRKLASLVLVTTSFPISGDGSEAAGSFVSDLAEALATQIPVRVVAPGRVSSHERWPNGVEVFRYAAPGQPLSTLKPWRPRDLRWIARVMRGGLAATRAATDDGGGHVLALWGLPCGEWARRVALERGIGYSVWMLGSDVWSLGRIPVLRNLLARVIRQADRAYADGYRLAEDAQRIAGIPVEFLPSTRRIDLLTPLPPREKSPYRLLFLGRWHPNKGVDLLLDALAQFCDDDWRRIEQVEIQGGGPLEDLVRERVLALQSAGRPVHAGRYLAKPEAEAAIMRADWVLIPSRIESIPVVFSDAMKLGRPVVAMPVGDLPRLLASGCGVLSKDTSAGGFMLAMRAAMRLTHQDVAKSIAACADGFSLDLVASRIISGQSDKGVHD